MTIKDDECEALWHAVLKQAIDDAQSIQMWVDRMAMYNKRYDDAHDDKSLSSARNAYLQAKDQHRQCVEARDWLLKPNKDFNWVCGVLGLDPEETRVLVKQILDSAPITGIRSS